MRNPNGFGSVVKLSGNRRRPYVAKITIGYKQTTSKKTGKKYAKPIYNILGYFCEQELARAALVDYYRNPLPIKADITLEELYTEWSEGKYQYISKQTEDCYKAGWKHLSKYGNMKFTELRTAQIQSVIDSLHKAKKSRSTLEKVKVVASMLYSYAMQNDITNKNYAEFIRLPKAEKEEKETFSEIEIQLLEKAGANEWVMSILILIYTGLRINELLSLTSFSINMNNQTITGGLKTDAGRDRTIPIHPKILKCIQYWLNKKGERLICNAEGKPIRDKYYREKLYYPALKQLGIRELNPHCCRHTFASILRKAGADTKTIQMLMGHTKYSFTADTYTHTNIAELKTAINKM